MRYSSSPDGRRIDADWRDAQVRMSELRSYYRWILSLVGRHLGARVLEVGCGIGNFTELLAARCSYVAGIDIDPVALGVARRRLVGCRNVEFFEMDLGNCTDNAAGGAFDTIVCLDVIEHLANDEGALRWLTACARRSGSLLVKVPACPWLYGEVDRASGHYRRYTTAELAQLARRAGWKTISCRYMNVCGVVPYWFTSRVLRKRSNFSRAFSHWQWPLIRAMVPVARAVDAATGPPIGQSAILIARLNSVS